jgi:hypothetical protein
MKGKSMRRRHLITVGFLFAALLLYYFGLEKSATALWVGGMVCELVFWKRLFRRKLA